MISYKFLIIVIIFIIILNCLNTVSFNSSKNYRTITSQALNLTSNQNGTMTIEGNNMKFSASTVILITAISIYVNSVIQASSLKIGDCIINPNGNVNTDIIIEYLSTPNTIECSKLLLPLRETNVNDVFSIKFEPNVGFGIIKNTPSVFANSFTWFNKDGGTLWLTTENNRLNNITNYSTIPVAAWPIFSPSQPESYSQKILCAKFNNIIKLDIKLSFGFGGNDLKMFTFQLPVPIKDTVVSPTSNIQKIQQMSIMSTLITVSYLHNNRIWHNAGIVYATSQSTIVLELPKVDSKFQFPITTVSITYFC